MERKCPRCGSLSAILKGSMTTLIGFSSYYDEEGNYISNDPNKVTTNYVCMKCGNVYNVTTQQGESTIRSYPCATSNVLDFSLSASTKPAVSTIRERVEQWAIDRGLDKVDPTKQMVKLMEEVGELASSLTKNDRLMMIDSIGDIYVVLVILAMRLKIDIDAAIESAYQVIKDRKGELVNGIFVKKEDLNKKL